LKTLFELSYELKQHQLDNNSTMHTEVW